MCLSKKILYQYFVFLALLGTTSPLKTCYKSLHSPKNLIKKKKNYKNIPTPDSLN